MVPERATLSQWAQDAEQPKRQNMEKKQGAKNSMNERLEDELVDFNNFSMKADKLRQLIEKRGYKVKSVKVFKNGHFRIAYKQFFPKDFEGHEVTVKEEFG